MARAATVTVALCRHFLRCVRVHRHWLLPLLLAAPVTHTHDGDGASSANNGLRNGACGLNGSVGAPLAPFGNSDGRSGSIGAPPATREYLAPSPTTSASAPASSAPVPHECSGASSAINGIRNGACGHNGSVGAPLVLAGNGGDHGGSTGASLATCGNSAPASAASAPTFTSAASRTRGRSSASSATHGRRNGAGGHGCSVITPLVVHVDPADLGPAVCTIEGCGRPLRIQFVD